MDIDFEQWDQEDTIWPWLMDSTVEPDDYEWTHEEDER